MAAIDFDQTYFEENFPAYTGRPEAQGKFSIGKLYISDDPRTLPDESRKYALHAMAAHLLFISDEQLKGNMTRIVTNGSEMGVSVSLALPSSASSDNFSYWMMTTPYGSDVIAMLSAQVGSGIYISSGSGFPSFGGGF